MRSREFLAWQKRVRSVTPAENLLDHSIGKATELDFSVEPVCEQRGSGLNGADR
jgi:hypothetical protein